MVLFLVLAGVLCLGIVLLFDTGQSVNKKVQLTHTADAAAYSVAVQQARVMNYAAYMNRGRIANEVAIAQLVSLWSWMNMIHTHVVAGYNLFTVLSAVPYVNFVARPLAQIYRAAEKGVATMRDVYQPLAAGGIQALDGLNGLLAGSAQTMLELGATVDGIKIARDVVEKNDPTARIGPLGLGVLTYQLRDAASSGAGGLLDEFKRRGPGIRVAGMDRYRNVVMASRDHFSADRRDSNPFLILDLQSRGGTDMVDYDRWAALDTLDLEIDVGFFELDAPLGWGGAQAVKDKNGKLPAFQPGIRSGGSNRTGNGWYSDYHPGKPTYAQYGTATHSTARLAARNPSLDGVFAPMQPSGKFKKHRDAYFGGYDGLRTYHDVKQKYGRSPEGENAGPVFSVYVESDRATARTSQDIDGIGGPAGGQLELKSTVDKMTAISTAQVYFNRPPSHSLFRRVVPKAWNGNPVADNQLEMGSLFSPYWQARLVETPLTVYTAVGVGSLVGGGP